VNDPAERALALGWPRWARFLEDHGRTV